MAGTDRKELKALEILHARVAADVRLASSEVEWHSVAASRFHLRQLDIALPPLNVPIVGLNYGGPFHLERTLHGRRRTAHIGPGHLAIVPANFASRWVCDRAGDVVAISLSRDLLDRAIEERAGRVPPSVEIIPKFAIRDMEIERIAHQLLSAMAHPRRYTGCGWTHWRRNSRRTF